jgi:apolipoprotein N-acyltransferase
MTRNCYTSKLRNMSKRAWGLAAISGGLQVLVFPTPNLYWLCWVALAPLLVAVMRARVPDVAVPQSFGRAPLRPAGPAQAFLLGWLSGILWYAGSCYWIMYTMHVYGGLAAPVAFGVLVLFCLAMGAHTGLFALLLAVVANGVGKRRSSTRRALVLAPFLWVAVEFARAHIIAFPWDLLGTAQVDNIPLTRLATVTGVYGLSFEILLVNTAFAAAFLAPRDKRKLLFVAALLAAIVLQLSVLVQPPLFPATGTARLVQQNIAIDDNWSPESFRRTLDQLTQKSMAAPEGESSGKTRVDLIVWPESPAPFYVNDPLFRSMVSQVAAKTQAYVIVGTLGVTGAHRGKLEPPQIFNSAALVSPDGQWTARYDKIHLVPFGEYVPFKAIFGFAHQLTREVGDFIPGSQRTVFDLGTFKAGTFICYESIFPGEVRQFAANGAQIFVNISNDEWFGHSAAPYQHLNQSRMRAIENERWVLRDTNTGITATIDPYGRILEQAPRDVLTALTAPFSVVMGTTFYTRHGDWFAWLCVIISMVPIFLTLPPVHRVISRAGVGAQGCEPRKF